MRQFILALLVLATPLHAEFSFSEKAKAIELYEGKDLITAFRTDNNFPYLYPVHSPSGATTPFSPSQTGSLVYSPC